MTPKTLTIALVCGTAQAGYSISSMHMIADFHLQFFQQYFLCTPVRPMAWCALGVFALSCKYFYEAIMAEDDDEDHGKRE